MKAQDLRRKADLIHEEIGHKLEQYVLPAETQRDRLTDLLAIWDVTDDDRNPLNVQVTIFGGRMTGPRRVVRDVAEAARDRWAKRAAKRREEVEQLKREHHGIMQRLREADDAE